jgi:hypothetical protein
MRNIVLSFALAVGMAPVLFGQSVGPTSPPFTQCPPVGADTSCGILILYDANGGVTVKTDASQPAYEHIDDTLVGVQNNSSGYIYAIQLSGSLIFGFDGDGVCGTDPNTGLPISPRPAGCPFAPFPGFTGTATGYEGQIYDGKGGPYRNGVSFTVKDINSGTVNFDKGIPPGGWAWFTLENSGVQISTCGSDPGDQTQTYFVTNFGNTPDSCPTTPGGRTPTWGSFGAQTQLTAASGEILEVRCDSYKGGALSFILYYTAPGGQARPVGINAWPYGCNTIAFKATTNPSVGTQPKCFQTTNFQSIDNKYNTNHPNPVTGEIGETDLDFFVATFNAATGAVTKTDDKYQYTAAELNTLAHGGQVDVCATSPTFVSRNFVKSFVIDPPLGPQTDAFFASVLHTLTTLPPGTSEENPIKPADLNKDGKVDTNDFLLFRAAFGSCAGQPRFVATADLDFDGCVTFKDYQIFLPLFNAK